MQKVFGERRGGEETLGAISKPSFVKMKIKGALYCYLLDLPPLKVLFLLFQKGLPGDRE